MGDRKGIIGAGAVLFGVGSALLTGTAVANADTAEPDAAGPSATSASDSSASTPVKNRRGSTRSAAAKSPAAPSPAATVDAGRSDRRAAPTASVGIRQGSKNTAPAPDVSVAPEVAPDGSPTQSKSQSRAAVAAPTAADVSAPATVAPAAATAPVAARITASATPSAVARPAPAAAPVTSALLSVLTALGWNPANGPVAALPTATAWSASRQTAAAVAVAPAAVVAGDPPPDPEVVAFGAELADPLLPGSSNGVSGVQIGHSRLAIPGAFIGSTVGADWYFPTQVDGTVDAQGVIWLQHGFGATNDFYSALAQDLAARTNSIVVAPTLSSIPFTFSGGCLICTGSEEAAAAAFLDPNRTALVNSAVAAGYTGDLSELKGAFVLAGHSAGGGFATATAADYLNQGSAEQDANLVGVVLFDGVSNGAMDGSFTTQVETLLAANKPIYTIAAPAQSWNAFGATTNALAEAASTWEGGAKFAGVVLTNGSHVDSMLGVNPLFDGILQLVAGRVPAGNTDAVYTLSTGWINDMYQGYTPEGGDPSTKYGFYAGANEQIIMGPTAALALPTPIANQLSFGDKVLTSVIDAVGRLFGFSILPTPYNNGPNGVNNVLVPQLSNGVTGVRTGGSTLTIPSGQGYNAAADWYFPTQADGSVQANGVIWLQHGFLGFKDWYAQTAQSLAQETNSIVVVPNIFWFDPAYTGVDAAQMFLGSRSELNVSANAAGFQGALPEKFILTGHSAGGRFATAMGATYVGLASEQELDNLLGVVMFDGVSSPPAFTDQLTILKNAGIPDYQIAAPAQRWNAYGRGTEAMNAVFPDQFYGVQIDNGSHTDVIGGFNLFGILGTIASGLIVKQSPPGGKEAVRTLANGWINDIYSGVYGPTDPFYGIYGAPNDGTYVQNQPIVMGEAGATTLPAPPPVDINQYAGKWYELGSVKLPFEWFLVNTTATYTPNPDGSVKVQNAGNYFRPNGPGVTITGSAVPVNDFNTRLNVGFFFGTPGGGEPGNYWILDYAPNYSWAIVSDPTGFSGYILSRTQTLPSEEYQALVSRAKLLGVWGPITVTPQYPA